MVTIKLVTAAEFAALPDDGWRYELIDGVPHRMPAGGFQHGDIGSGLLVALRAYAHPRGLGRVVGVETGFLFRRQPDQVRVPDVAFVRADRLPPPEQRTGYLSLVPDLVVEVISPTDEPAGIAEKIAFYLDVGVPLQWWVNPAPRIITVYRPGRDPVYLGVDDTLDGEEIVPGFRLPVADVFV